MEPTQRELYLLDQELSMMGDAPTYTYTYAVVPKECTDYPIASVQAHSSATARVLADNLGYHAPDYGVRLIDEVI